jgi:syntaxin 5
MDRTREFFTILRRERDAHSPLPQFTPRVSHEDEFSRRAHKIHEHIQYSAETLHSLQSLTKSENVLGQNDDEIRHLVASLNTDFTSITEAINSLDSGRSSFHSNIAKSLRRDLTSLMDQFSASWKTWQKTVQDLEERRAKRTGATSRRLPQFTTAYNDSETEVAPRQDLLQIHNQQTRYEGVLAVERSVHEISSLFVELSEIIARDDYTIMRIDEATEEAVSNMEKGQAALAQYYGRIKGNKCLMLKVFAVLIVFALIFLLII